MSENTALTKGRMLAMAVVWLGIVGVGVLAYRFWWKPSSDKAAQEEAIAQEQEVLEKTSASSSYKHEVAFAIDGFSGYAPWRSSQFANQARVFSTRLNLHDDQAIYQERYRKIQSGETPIGVFTVDALYKVCAETKTKDATIIAVLDETKGADAMIGAGKRFPNIDALNQPNLRIVCMADSPSETLARVVMEAFHLDQLPKDCFDFKNSPEEIVEAWRNSSPTDNIVFVTWEPYVSMMLKNPEYHVIVDSSKFSGYICDVLVCQRDYLIKNEDVVTGIVKSYFTTIFNERNNMVQMVSADAKNLGAPLTSEQAERLTTGIWWKNTQENYAHFGISPQPGIQNLEDICRNISKVLIATGGINGDPTNGQPTLMFYDGIMRNIQASGWHPGFGREMVREEKSLKVLSEQEWGELEPVGTLQVPRLVFARGTDRLSSASHRTLDDLVEKLKTWPQYYLIVRGNTSSRGDVEANRKLAEGRAKAAVDYLVSKGIDTNRLNVETSKPNGSTTVAFILGEQPY